jgi:hypothetical protein
MRPSAGEVPSAGKRPIHVWLATLIALGIGLVALGSAWAALGPNANGADRVAALPNLLTGLASVAGGIGYWLGRRWGLYAYALSVAGHLLIHSAFLLSALGSGRFAPVSIVGLAIIPVVSLGVLVVMWRDQRQARLS